VRDCWRRRADRGQRRRGDALRAESEDLPRGAVAERHAEPWALREEPGEEPCPSRRRLLAALAEMVASVSLALGLDTVIATSKVMALCWPLRQYADQTDELMREHPFLIPEIEAANAHVAQAGDALKRAIDALQARYDAEKDAE
jgi:hypothetical protein